MLKLEHYRNKLNTPNKVYSDEELEKIRALLYALAKAFVKNLTKTESISLIEEASSVKIKPYTTKESL